MNKLASILIAILVFGLMIVGLATTYSSMTTTYNVTDEINASGLITDYDHTSEIGNDVVDSSKLLLNKTVTEGSATDNTLRNSWAAIKVSFKSPNIVYKIIMQTAKETKMPAWIVTTLYIMVLLVVVWLIIGIFTSQVTN